MYVPTPLALCLTKSQKEAGTWAAEQVRQTQQPPDQSFAVKSLEMASLIAGLEQTMEFLCKTNGATLHYV